MKFGAHLSTAGGVWKALQRGVSIGCQIVVSHRVAEAPEFLDDIGHERILITDARIDTDKGRREFVKSVSTPAFEMARGAFDTDKTIPRSRKK